MKVTAMRLGLGIILLLMLAAGCTKPYKITYGLEQPLEQKTGCVVGEIQDELPIEMDPAKKPTLEQIEKLRGWLEKELDKTELFGTVGALDSDGPAAAGYRVTGGIIEFKRGSGFVRFLGLFGLGNSYLTVRLALVDNASGSTVFEGNFKQAVTSWMESGDKTFERVAKSFAGAIKSENKKILKRK